MSALTTPGALTGVPEFDPHKLTALRATIREAAALALPLFRHGARTSARIWSKSGGSPVTEADIAVDTFLKVRLSELEPGAAWLSEETCDDPARLDSDLVWIVDPIDGTRAFLSGHPDWSVAVALLSRGEPVLGFVYAPALDAFYEAAQGGGAFRNGVRLAVSSAPSLDGARVAGPKTLVERMLSGAAGTGHRPQITLVERVPSLALRVARVAEGTIDLGLIAGVCQDWDLAAADLILREAGGAVIGLDGEPAVYNRAEPQHGELIAGSETLRSLAFAALEAS